jgi:candicidin polyketide synthase FscB
MIKALQHGRLPRTLHVDEPSPHVDWAAGSMELLTEARDWPDTGRPRRAAVSSFGISGTNAHVILEQAPSAVNADEPGARELRVVPCVLSGRGRTGLRAQARQLLEHVRDRADITDIGFSLATTRSRLANRAVVLAADRDELVDALRAIADDQLSPAVVEGSTARTGRTALVFPGQGGQWPGMAVELLDSSPVFAAHMLKCEQAFASLVDWSPVDVLRRAPGAPGLDQVDVVQPVLFAVMTSLASVWRSLGVLPDAVVGHSQGEIAAAYVAGALSLADAARVVILRSRALVTLAGTGGMVSIQSSVDDVRARLAQWGERVNVAAVNGPANTVVSGDVAALDELMTQLDDVRARRVPVDYASHSVQVELLREELTEALAGITPRSSDVAFFSTVTGTRIDTAELGADYWFQNLRETVQFEQAMRAMHVAGYGVYIEAGPHPVLTMGIEETLADCGADPHATVVVGSLRRGEGDLRRMLASLAEAYVRGVDVAWANVFENTGARRVDLPTCAFQRQRFWLAPATVGSGARERGAETSNDETAVSDATEDGAHRDADSADLTRRLAAMSEHDQRRTLLDLVRTHAAIAQGHSSPTAVDSERGLRDQGFTSVAAVDFRNRLGAASGLRLPITIAFDHPSPAALADYLRGQLLAQARIAAPAVLAEIDKLDSALSTTSMNDQERSSITSRLEELLSRWNTGSGQSESAGAAHDLATASDQELIDYIGNELGIS